MAGVTSDLECPVCHEDYKEPKILPCTHLVCQKCVVTWLGKGGQQAGCPLCRAPVLSPTRQGQGDLVTLVDALPTDLATMALVERNKVLHGPHVCTTCQNNVTATSYCFQCEVKLCTTCVSYHQRFPALKDHTLENLSKLTGQQLAACRRSKCNSHTDRLAELFCSSHEERICILCSSTNHRGCPDVKAITDVAKEKRTELRREAQELRDQEAKLAKQIKTAQDKFNAMHKKANDIFDDIQQYVEKRRQEVINMIKKEKDASVTSLGEAEKVRAAMMSHAGTVDHLLTSAPDDSLLQMLKQLKQRLDDVKSRKGSDVKTKTTTDIAFDTQLLTRLKSDVDKLGDIIQTADSPVSTPLTALKPTRPSVTTHQTVDKPRGAALAKVLKVGHRVKRGPGWLPVNHNEDGTPPGPGTVTAIPSKRAGPFLKRKGSVDVRWDSGGKGYYHMGFSNKYELDLV